MREIFTQSSNVGAARLAMSAGIERQRAFLGRLGLADGMRTDIGGITPPRLPARWGELELVTISYGHGLALAPMQIAAAAAALVNGGIAVQPTYVRSLAGQPRRAVDGQRVLRAETSAAMRDMMRRSVTAPGGTGVRAEVAGYEIGGKTGTAEIAIDGRYQAKAVVASFLGAFPMSAPRYVLLVSLVEPKGSEETRGRITAGVNAAPTVARIVTRIGPLLDIARRTAE